MRPPTPDPLPGVGQHDLPSSEHLLTTARQRRAVSDRRTRPPHLAAPPAPPRGPLGNGLPKMELAECACARRAPGGTSYGSTNGTQETNALRMRFRRPSAPRPFPGSGADNQSQPRTAGVSRASVLRRLSSAVRGSARRPLGSGRMANGGARRGLTWGC